MIVVLNLLLVGLGLLIAYWWANQGAFSALLHLLCVLAAGVLAFAIWEPVSVRVLSMGALSNFAWGIGLLAPFALFLFIFRMASDKLVPANLNFPQLVNYAVGGALGLAAGLITMGILMLGGGLLQSERAFMGYQGWVRSSANQGKPVDVKDGLWIPMHTLTARFFETLSGGSFAPETGSASLANRQPNLDQVSMSLARDGANAGRSRIAIAPDAIDVTGFAYSPTMALPAALGGRDAIYAVGITVRQPGYDQGVQFRLSASQVRLIGGTTADGQKAATEHPIAWTAEIKGGGSGLFPFDDTSHYITSVPGQQEMTAWMLFPAKEFGSPEQGRPPRFIQVKGLRIALPAIEMSDAASVMAKLMGQGGSTTVPTFDPELKSLSAGDLEATNSLKPLRLSTNQIPGMKESEGYLIEGRGSFSRSNNFRISKGLEVKGILQPEDTRVVRLNISRGKSPVNIWDSKFREEAGDTASLLLVDAGGRAFAPFGYIHDRRNDGEVDVVLEPIKGISKISEFPSLSSAGVDDLYALYRVSVGSTIKAVRLGDIQIANADLLITEK